MQQTAAADTRSRMPKGRGGKRPGSGRKPNYLKRLGIKAITAAEILAHHNEPELWKGLLTHKSPDVRLRTLQYLTEIGATARPNKPLRSRRPFARPHCLSRSEACRAFQ